MIFPNFWKWPTPLGEESRQEPSTRVQAKDYRPGRSIPRKPEIVKVKRPRKKKIDKKDEIIGCGDSSHPTSYNDLHRLDPKRFPFDPIVEIPAAENCEFNGEVPEFLKDLGTGVSTSSVDFKSRDDTRASVDSRVSSVDSSTAVSSVDSPERQGAGRGAELLKIMQTSRKAILECIAGSNAMDNTKKFESKSGMIRFLNDLREIIVSFKAFCEYYSKVGYNNDDLLIAVGSFLKESDSMLEETRENPAANDEKIYGHADMVKVLNVSYNGLENIYQIFLNNLSNFNDDVADAIRETGGHIDEYRLMDVSKSRVLVVQIDEDLYLKDGYRSLEPLMKKLQEKGIVVVAIPKSINLLSITEKDLAKMDLYKINKIIRQEET